MVLFDIVAINQSFRDNVLFVLFHPLGPPKQTPISLLYYDIDFFPFSLELE